MTEAPEGAKFDEARIDALKNDVAKKIGASQLVLRVAPKAQDTFEDRLRRARVESEEILVQIGREELNRLRQQHKQRTAFFGWAIAAISGVLVVSGVFMGIYFAVKGSDVEPAVMIAWLSSGLVETLGLGYIIANYLFAGNGKSGATKT